MKICVLSPANGWHYLDLKRAAGHDFSVDNIPFEALNDSVDAIEGEHLLEKYDCIIARAMPAGTLQQVVFRMDVLLELERKGHRIVNPPRTIEMSVDKYLSLKHLQRKNIPVPRTAVSQSVDVAMQHFEWLGGNVVVKPIFGSMGRGLTRINSARCAEQKFAEVLGVEGVVYQQTFIDHAGFDLRLLVLGGQVFGMKRVNPDHWVTNIAQGAKGLPYVPTDFEQELAVSATHAVGAEIAGVDLVYDRETCQPYVLEINSAPSWQAISAVLEIDIARKILEYLL